MEVSEPEDLGLPISKVKALPEKALLNVIYTVGQGRGEPAKHFLWQPPWLRMKLDALVMHDETTATVIDFKTGRKFGNEVVGNYSYAVQGLGHVGIEFVKLLKERGAKRVFAYATHPIFSGNALQNIKNSVIDEFVVCETIPLTPEIKALEKVRTLTLSGMLAEAIRRISNEESISAMFEH